MLRHDFRATDFNSTKSSIHEKRGLIHVHVLIVPSTNFVTKSFSIILEHAQNFGEGDCCIFISKALQVKNAFYEEIGELFLYNYLWGSSTTRGLPRYGISITPKL